jgi:predicted TIM-barrel fold metal-dependent hydrolase
MRLVSATLAVLIMSACSRQPEGSADPALAAEIERIRAIDNHAHPVRNILDGPPDREFDALPVDNMEPASDPVGLRAESPGIRAADQALYGTAASKRQIQRDKGDNYTAWVLDQAGIETMLANRVAMGAGIQAPRFRWVPYADALIFPLDNSHLAANSDRRSFFALEDILRRRYLGEAGLPSLPPAFADYLSRVITATLERQKTGGAVAEKFEAAYLRSLDFNVADRADAERVYARYRTAGAPPDADYKVLQDFLFRYIASECGRLGMVVHIHTAAGAGGYFHVAGENPLLLESVLNDPSLRKTRFVMLHGGWPFTSEITPLLEKPNAYLDFSMQDLLEPPGTLASTLRLWLEWVPEKVLFGTDGYPYSDPLGWEESTWISSRTARQALVIALTGMLRDGEITRDRALELARMVLRDNARKLYGL